MKGLLQRLAARATGTALPIRSDARLPFVKARPLLEERGEGVDVASRGEEISPRPATTPMTAPRAAGSPQPLLANNPADSPVQPKLAPAAAREAPTSTPRVDTIADPARRGEGVPASSAQPAGTRPGQTTAAPRVETAERTRPQDADELPRAPARLLPRDSGEPATVARRPSELPAVARRETAAMPAEVHLHIGRIEVAAVAPPSPAPRTRSAPRPAATQLDSYLSRRRK